MLPYSGRLLFYYKHWTRLERSARDKHSSLFSLLSKVTMKTRFLRLAPGGRLKRPQTGFHSGLRRWPESGVGLYLSVLLGYTACHVCLVSTVSGHRKYTLGGESASSRHITKHKQYTFLKYLWIILNMSDTYGLNLSSDFKNHFSKQASLTNILMETYFLYFGLFFLYFFVEKSYIKLQYCGLY